MLHAGMVGMGETHVAAFALASGFDELSAGLLVTIPVFAGATLQLFTPLAVTRLGSYRRWVIFCAALQSVVFCVLAASAWSGHVAIALLFVTAAFYWAAAFSAGSAWNAWMAWLVPGHMRARFFAHRNRLGHLALAASLLIAGSVLWLGQGADATLVSFGAIFAAAALFRTLSGRCIARQSEAPVVEQRGSLNLDLGFLREFAAGSSGRLLAYLVSMELAVYVAAPYFTPYMLRRLELSFAEYVALTGTVFVSRISVMPLLGRFAARYGPRRLLVLSAMGVAPLPLLWLVSTEFEYLVGVQLFAGVVWGGHELAVLLLLFDSIDPARRISVLSAYNFANASAMIAGSLIGSVLLRAGGGESLYALVFLASALGRGAVLGLVARLPAGTVRGVPIALRTLALRPNQGAIQPPLVGSLDPAESGEGPEELATLRPGE